MMPLPTRKTDAMACVRVAVAVALGCSAALANAMPASAQFSVTATLVSANSPALPKSAFCQTSPALAFGALLTVVCATGEVVDITTAPAQGGQRAPVNGAAYRFILPSSYADGLPGFYDADEGRGTIASWRIIRLADRQYYEFLVGW